MNAHTLVALPILLLGCVTPEVRYTQLEAKPIWGVRVKPLPAGGRAEPIYLGTLETPAGGYGAHGIGYGGGGLGAGGYGVGGLGLGGGGHGIGVVTGNDSGNGRETETLPKRIELSPFAYAEIELPYRRGAPTRFLGREDATIHPPEEVKRDFLSTFSIDVDTAAYAIARRSLVSHRLPEPSLVRVEEFINYFRYDYEPPTGRRELFAIQADGAIAPTDPSKHLLRIGIQGKTIADEKRLPVNLVFLVDVSGSMMSDDKLELAKKGLKIAVDELTANDSVAITTYAGRVSLVLPATSGEKKEQIKQAIDDLRSGGGTAMESGLLLAYRQAASTVRDDALTRIIVCSDGDANIGETSPDALLERIAEYASQGVFLSTIGFGAGNYRDAMMEQLANKGNGNYFYIDSKKQAERVFGKDLIRMVYDIAQDVKIQVSFNPTAVRNYRLVGYENRDIRDEDFRNDNVDAGEIGAGHQVTAIYELNLADSNAQRLATVRVRAKRPRGTRAKEIALDVPVRFVSRRFHQADADFRFAAAVMASAELLRGSPHAHRWTLDRIIAIAQEAGSERDEDRREFIALMRKASQLKM